MAWAIATIANDEDGFEPAGVKAPEPQLVAVGDPAAHMSHDEVEGRWGRRSSGDFWGERDGWLAPHDP
jgi:hypothetical protein